MTELGNGTSIQSFETTSTFCRTSDTFAINSPTLTSTKWWIGMAAQVRPTPRLMLS
jgi:acyl-CoA oxidase